MTDNGQDRDQTRDILGATLRDGGGTWQVRPDGLWPVGQVDSWAVGGADSEYRGPVYGLRLRADVDDIVPRLRSKVGVLLARGAQYLGTWVEDGDIFLDACDLVSDRDEAIAVGRSRGEIAIYKLDTGETVYLDGEG